VLDCPTDYFKETVDGDNLCVTSQYTTERLVVDPSSSDSSVYQTLYAAMYAVSAQKSTIYLVAGSHTLEIDSAITPSSEKELDPLYQTATKKSFKLTTAYCDEINVPNCVSDSSKSTVLVREPLLQITSYFNTFEITNLIFDGASALDASCTDYYCQYCPYYEEIAGSSYFYDDRYSDHSKSLISDRQWKTDCDKYKAVNFINSGSLKVGSFSISSCEFNNFRYEMKSVVTAANIKVNIEDTVFSNIVPYTSAVYIGEDSEVSIQGITVRLLNNGFEYRNDIRQNPFLYLESTAAVTIEESTFSMNLAMRGSDASVDDHPSALIYARNFKRTVAITSCTFTNNWATAGLIKLDVTTLSWTETYTNSVQDQLTWMHLVLKDCTFSYNGGNYLVYYLMDLWPHNFELSGLTFSHNYVDKSLIDIEKLHSITTYSPNGGLRYLTVNSTKMNVKYSKQSGVFTRLTFSNNNYVLGNIHLKQICNVSLTSLTSANNGSSSSSFASVILEPYINDPDTYITTASNFVLAVACSSSYRFEDGSSLSITSSTFTDDTCSSGVGGIHVADDLAALTFQGLTFYNVRSSSLEGGVLAVDSPGGAVSLGPSFNIEECENSRGPAGIGIANSNSTITYKESYCRTNTGAFGTCAAMTEVGLMTMTSVVFTDNAATSGSGAALYFSTGASESDSLHFSVQSCTFTSNKAKTQYGGAMYLTATGSSPGLTLTVSSTTFTSNYAKLQGSAVYISSSFELKTDSGIDSCSFTDNSSGKNAALALLYSKGKLTVKNTPFKGNSGTNSVSSLYVLFWTDGVAFEVESCEFTNNTGSMVIYVASIEQGNSLITTKINVHDNPSIGLVIDTLNWTETGSVIQNNSRGGVQTLLTVATLIGTKFAYNTSSASGAAAKVNNSSVFSCHLCEFIGNKSLNNGGALIVEIMSKIAISDSKFADNYALGSGSAVCIISSTEISTLKGVTITNNSCENAGAIALLSGLLTVEDCSMTGNTAVGGNPGIFVNSSTLTVKRTKFYSQS
jgi:hypothetical protein